MARFEVELEILSPLHIGSGEVWSQLDYIPEEGRVYIINFGGIIEEVSPALIDDLTRDILQNFSNNRWRGNLKEFLARYKLAWRRHVLATVAADPGAGGKEIRQFIRTTGGPYLPGSSLKGTMRTAVLYQILKADPGLAPKDDREVQRLIGRTPQDDLFRALAPSDSPPLGESRVALIYNYNLRRDAKTAPMALEIVEGVKTSLSLRIDEKALDHVKSDLFRLSKGSLIDACNAFAQALISRELEEVKVPQIHSFYQWLEGMDLAEDECVLRLGRGSGRWGTTVQLVPQILNPGLIPKTRNFVYRGGQPYRPLGWVKLRFESTREHP